MGSIYSLYRLIYIQQISFFNFTADIVGQLEIDLPQLFSRHALHVHISCFRIRVDM
jgi:hypothetical protein